MEVPILARNNASNNELLNNGVNGKLFDNPE